MSRATRPVPHRALEPCIARWDLVDVALDARVAMGYADRAYFDLVKSRGLQDPRNKSRAGRGGHWQRWRAAPETTTSTPNATTA